MVEIALYESRESVDVVHIGAGRVRVAIGQNHTSDHIADALLSNGLSVHVHEAVDLFSNDATPRKFENQGEFVLITRDESVA